MALQCGQRIVHEIAVSVVILYASFIITGLIQLREREPEATSYAHAHMDTHMYMHALTHTKHCKREHRCPRGKLSLFGLGDTVCGLALKWERNNMVKCLC